VTSALAAMLIAGLATVTSDRPGAEQSPSADRPQDHTALTTPWTKDVSPDNALPKYPRPQLRRASWRNLNGLWQFAGASRDEAPPTGHRLPGRVLVPYPVESALSGVTRHEDRMLYRRTFTVPKSWAVGRDQDLRLNFGAVDYRATVWVNGQLVARHTGGYDAFSVDVTRALRPQGPQELVVGVEDRTDRTWQPVGKQRRVPDRGIFYTSASGIWQTVWMEPVPRQGFVERLDMTPDIDSSTLRLDVRTGGASETVRRGLTVRAMVRDGRTRVSSAVGVTDRSFRVPVPRQRLWSPAHPFLYHLDVTLRRGRRTVDHVTSYFGMREIGERLGKDGRLHITLNHKTLFLMGVLDQGYWPDGIYTAPTDEALRSDIVAAKRLGFNTIRKHMKVEPDRWYYHADRIGMLVWQDMPAMRTEPVGSRSAPPPKAREEFERQLHAIVVQHRSWTSIIGWVPFNEGWGEWDRAATRRIATSVRRLDPSRLVDAESGVNCCRSLSDSGRGDVVDWHAYPGPATPSPDGRRVAIAGEHGGFGLEVPGHLWFGDGSAYRMAHSKAELTRLYVAHQETLLREARDRGLSGAFYTQLTDVEHEVNGFYTYDRRVAKMDLDRVRAVNERGRRAGAT
jgi:beta-galactosidase/beta-glucuronidase